MNKFLVLFVIILCSIQPSFSQQDIVEQTPFQIEESESDQSLVDVRVLSVSEQDRARYRCCISLQLPTSYSSTVTLLAETKEYRVHAERLPKSHEGKVKSTKYYYLSIADSSSPERTHYYIYVRARPELSRSIIRIGDTRYPIAHEDATPSDTHPEIVRASTTKAEDFKANAHTVTAVSRTEYGVLQDCYTATANRWSNSTLRHALNTTVKLDTSVSRGTGTIINVPEWLAEQVADDQMLVVTAAHVVPRSVEQESITITTFSYDSRLRPSIGRKFIGKVLRTVDYESNPDIAYVLFSPGDIQLPATTIADKFRWASAKQSYLCIGVPQGTIPRFSFQRVLRCVKTETGAKFTVLNASHDGESGGGLFDPDGVLLGIRARTDEVPTYTPNGEGLFDAPEEGDGQIFAYTSLFWHASSRYETASVQSKDTDEHATLPAIR